MLQIVSQDNADGTTTFSYTWRGHASTSFNTLSGEMLAGTGIEVIAKFTTKTTASLGNGAWYAAVITNTTDSDFKNSKPLDLAGSGTLTLTSAGYTLPYSAQFLSGSLTQ